MNYNINITFPPLMRRLSKWHGITSIEFLIKSEMPEGIPHLSSIKCVDSFRVLDYIFNSASDTVRPYFRVGSNSATLTTVARFVLHYVASLVRFCFKYFFSLR